MLATSERTDGERMLLINIWLSLFAFGCVIDFMYEQEMVWLPNLTR